MNKYDIQYPHPQADDIGMFRHIILKSEVVIALDVYFSVLRHPTDTA